MHCKARVVAVSLLSQARFGTTGSDPAQSAYAQRWLPRNLDDLQSPLLTKPARDRMQDLRLGAAPQAGYGIDVVHKHISISAPA
jgi:hypothetical protein